MREFEKIFIIGDGKVANSCKKIAQNFFNKEVFKIDTSNINSLDQILNSIKNSFIISANNFYIFKKECVENNFIINYHNSLLPKHKGNNAHIWAIWENDEKTGITWHKVDCDIDTGDIIIQKEIILDDTFTAIKLLQLQSNLAINSFEECLNKIYKNSPYKKQDKNNSYHKKNELPNNGILDISWDKNKISRFLRSMDNGNLTNKAKINISNHEYEISFFNINENNIELNVENIVISKN
ncbi:formyltransferase family protein [Campylobacter lari]|uniref:formyltransferase family protein n=1 Tax=Campylobacter lari TaxID=201 RepID=UPI0021F6EB7E|nr:formyltransferase family protein [Campylobacter lari]MCW0223886.1 formyltransferase family protein [Campylobacter lari]MCW0256652.1 formyltransferase family protein [Campylobacter lari]